jgi:hypothetical protein
MVFGSMSSFYLISETSPKVELEIYCCGSKSVSQGRTGLTGGDLEVT